jgi:hypothetical protein
MPEIPPELLLEVHQSIEINASRERAFEALLARLGPNNETPDGLSLQMTLEPWPGGRWFRDLGDGNGHFWGFVQVLKRPGLLELSGPMFMSYPVTSHLQFRISEVQGKSVLELRHLALGLIQPDHRQGVSMGWSHLLKGVRDDAVV